MNFIDTLKSSIYDPVFYRGLPGTPLRSSLSYFAKLAILLTVIGTIFFGISVLPPLTRFLKNDNLVRIANYFPEDLTFTLRGGTVSINGADPRYIDGPGGYDGSKHLIVIDTKTVLTPETEAVFLEDTMKKHDASIWISKDSVILIDEDGAISRTPLNGIPNLTITQEKVLHWIENFRTMASFIPLILLILIFLFIFGAYFTNLIYLFLIAFIIMLIGKSKGLILKYRDAYHVGIHAISLGMLVDMFFAVVPGFSGAIPFLSLAITLVTVTFNITSPGDTLPEGTAPTNPPETPQT